jgi:hypothetical protein|tara:strand:+ start:912 stop:1418 length:507 start_codon:yes stop_codon:yes gene_type:complete
MFSQQTEIQQYKVINTIDNVELRYYPPSIKAKVTSKNNFSKLFKYISGNNSDNTKIAMTAPVYMTNKGSLNTMEFVLPVKYLEKNIILPKDNSIEVYKSKEGVFASITYGGYSNSNKVSENYRLLVNKLNEKNIPIISNRPIVLSYNSPYKVFNRRNEVLLEVVYRAN